MRELANSKESQSSLAKAGPSVRKPVLFIYQRGIAWNIMTTCAFCIKHKQAAPAKEQEV